MNHDYKTKVLAIIEYDGSSFCGWAKQSNKSNTVQSTIELVLKKVFKQKIDVFSCSRTDKNVHACFQCISFSLNFKIVDVLKIQQALNKCLAPNIYIKKMKTVPNNFEVRFDVKTKTYLYIIKQSKENVFLSKYFWLLEKQKFSLFTDIKILQWKKLLLGTHNFKSFINKSGRKKDWKNFFRTINSIKIIKSTQQIKIYINGNGFGHNMVRMLIGILYTYVADNIDLSEIRRMIEEPKTTYNIYIAPASGLYLYRVYY